VERFLATHPDVVADGPALRVWPHRLDGGGFFGARLVKR
jgi:16S rRNA C967 or C1407 C5-methylase (RsmB/RsmF family)